MYWICALLGDQYHPAERSREAIELALEHELTAGTVRITYPTVQMFSSELAEKPDLVIVAKSNVADATASDQEEVAYDDILGWVDESTAALIMDYVKAGGSWLSWHSGLCLYEKHPGLREMVRGHFLFHPEQNNTHYYGTSQETQVEEPLFSFYDEHYFVECDKEQTEVFLSSRSAEGESAAAWMHSYGSGLVGALTPAHNRDNLIDSRFLTLFHDTIQTLLYKYSKEVI